AVRRSWPDPSRGGRTLSLAVPLQRRVDVDARLRRRPARPLLRPRPRARSVASAGAAGARRGDPDLVRPEAAECRAARRAGGGAVVPLRLPPGLRATARTRSDAGPAAAPPRVARRPVPHRSPPATARARR